MKSELFVEHKGMKKCQAKENENTNFLSHPLYPRIQ